MTTETDPPAETSTAAPAPEPADQPAPPAPGASAVRWVGKRLIAHPFGKLVAVIVGAMIGLAVESGVEATGVLGPGIDQLIEKQDANFASLDAKLEQLRSADSPEKARSLAGEIDALLVEQKRASARMADEVRGLTAENERLKAESLERAGTSGGADVWLKPGESITVAGRPGNVFALMSFTYRGRTEDLTVNVSGQRSRMVVGGHHDFPAEGGVWRVIYKQGGERADGRVGFDVVFVPGSG